MIVVSQYTVGDFKGGVKMNNVLSKRMILLFVLVFLFTCVVSVPIIGKNDIVDAKSKTVRITFYANGGVFEAKKHKGKRYTGKHIKYGSRINGMPKVKRTGYVLLGWYTKKKGGKQVYSTTKLRKNTKVYAKWSRPFSVNQKRVGLLGKKLASSSRISPVLGEILSNDMLMTVDGYICEYYWDNYKGYLWTREFHDNSCVPFEIDGRANRFVNINKTYYYKTFMKKLQVSKYKVEHSYLTFKKNNLEWTITLDKTKVSSKSYTSIKLIDFPLDIIE